MVSEMSTSTSTTCNPALRDVMLWSPGEQVVYLQDANLPGFLVIAVFAGLDLSLEVAESVGEKLSIQLVVVSLLTRDHQLLLLTGDLLRFANRHKCQLISP